MRILLDTQAFLWLIAGDRRVTRRARSVFLDPTHEKFLSMASAWEIAIKQSLGKLKLAASEIIQTEMRHNAISFLDIRFSHVTQVGTMAMHHRDPFDRLIIAQAQIEGLPVLGADRAFDRYDVRRVW